MSKIVDTIVAEDLDKRSDKQILDLEYKYFRSTLECLIEEEDPDLLKIIRDNDEYFDNPKSEFSDIHLEIVELVNKKSSSWTAVVKYCDAHRKNLCSTIKKSNCDTINELCNALNKVRSMSFIKDYF